MPSKTKLEYDAKVPAFLQRLKGQYPGPGERSHVQHARPRKELIDHDDDGPTYVDGESNETISKNEFDEMAAGGREKDLKSTPEGGDTPQNPEAKLDSVGGNENEPSGSSTSQNKTAFGASSKRKIVKVIGESRDVDGKPPKDEEADIKEQPDHKKIKKASKKGKKIKLSFDDEDG